MYTNIRASSLLIELILIKLGNKSRDIDKYFWQNPIKIYILNPMIYGYKNLSFTVEYQSKIYCASVFYFFD